MSELVMDFVQKESQVEGVVGIVVFGSFVKAEVRETSDIDLLVLMEDAEAYSRTRQRANGILLEVYRWSLDFFGKPFQSEPVNAFQDAFCFAVMRSGRILYDPKGILHEFKRYAQTHKLSYSHLESLLERAEKSLDLAQNHLEKRKLEGAGIEIRRAAEELARALLLEMDILEIIPPKIYLPHIRKEIPTFYRTFCEIHNVEMIQREKVEAVIQHISRWRERIVKEIHRIGKEDWLEQGGAIHGAQTELTNAQDCLENEDLEAAILQARYSAMLLMSPTLSILQGSRKSANPPSTRYYELLQSRHPYRHIVTSVMNFSRDRRRLEGYIEILGNVVKRYEQRLRGKGGSALDEIIVRRGREGDEKALGKLLESLREEDNEWKVLEGKEKDWIHNLTKDDRVHNKERPGTWLFFAFDGDRMIGHVNGIAWDRAPPESKQHVEDTRARYNLVGKNAGHVGISVHKDYRRKGVGEKLMQTAIKEAKELGVKVLATPINTENTPMIRLAEKLGFREHVRERKGERESILLTLEL